MIPFGSVNLDPFGGKKTCLIVEHMIPQALAIKICNRVCQWIKDVENEVFLLGASPFSW